MVKDNYALAKQLEDSIFGMKLERADVEWVGVIGLLIYDANNKGTYRSTEFS